MYDIVENSPAVLKKCAELEITPLILGKDVVIVKTQQELKNAAALLVLANTAERPLIEQAIDGVVHIEEIPKKDHLHFRRAGLDQVNAKILATDKKAYVISYGDLRNAKNVPEKLGRIQANCEIAKKLKVPVVLASFAKTVEQLPTPKDLQTFFKAMGIDEKQASNKEFDSWVARAELRASEKYVSEGVRRQ